jgi:hypothetical protein
MLGHHRLDKLNHWNRAQPMLFLPRDLILYIVLHTHDKSALAFHITSKFFHKQLDPVFWRDKLERRLHSTVQGGVSSAMFAHYIGSGRPMLRSRVTGDVLSLPEELACRRDVVVMDLSPRVLRGTDAYYFTAVLSTGECYLYTHTSSTRLPIEGRASACLLTRAFNAMAAAVIVDSYVALVLFDDDGRLVGVTKSDYRAKDLIYCSSDIVGYFVWYLSEDDVPMVLSFGESFSVRSSGLDAIHGFYSHEYNGCLLSTKSAYDGCVKKLLFGAYLADREARYCGTMFSTSVVKDICAYDTTVVALHHDGKLVMRDREIDRDVIAMTSYKESRYLLYVVEP